MKYIFFFILSIFISCLVPSCNDQDEILMEGSLTVTFKNRPQELIINIYSMQSMNTPIWSTPSEGKKEFKLPLNIGNYVIKPTSPTSSFFELAFQIRQGKESIISYDERNQGKVSTPH